MAITAKFATITENPKKIKKSVPLSGSPITISAWNTIDDLTCDFILDGSGYHDENYMQVDFPGITKYYFIDRRAGMPGNMVRLTGTIDVLTTYTSTILAAEAVINRTSDPNFIDPMLKDNKVTTRSVTELDSTLLLSNVISDTEFVYVGVLQKLPSLSGV